MQKERCSEEKKKKKERERVIEYLVALYCLFLDLLAGILDDVIVSQIMQALIVVKLFLLPSVFSYFVQTTTKTRRLRYVVSWILKV